MPCRKIKACSTFGGNAPLTHHNPDPDIGSGLCILMTYNPKSQERDTSGTPHVDK